MHIFVYLHKENKKNDFILFCFVAIGEFSCENINKSKKKKYNVLELYLYSYFHSFFRLSVTNNIIWRSKDDGDHVKDS